jgi:hypothetical protein
MGTNALTRKCALNADGSCKIAREHRRDLNTFRMRVMYEAGDNDYWQRQVEQLGLWLI